MSDNGIQLRCIVHAYDQEELTWSVPSDPATLTVLDDAPGTGFAADWFIEFSGTGTTHGYFVGQYGSLTPANTVVILITTDSAFVSMEDSAWPDTTGTLRYVRMFGAEYRLDPIAGNQWFIEDEALAALVIAASGNTIPVFIWDVNEIPGEGNPPEWLPIDDVTIFQSEAATYSRNMNDYVVSETDITAWTTTNGNITQPPAGGIWTPGTTDLGVITSYQTATNENEFTTQGDEWDLEIRVNTAEYDAYFQKWAWTSAYGQRLGPRPVAASDPGDGTLWISTDGTGDGSEGNPAGLHPGLDSVVPGDHVFFRGGVYHLTAQRHLIGSNNPELPVIYESYPGEMAVFDGGTTGNSRLACFDDNTTVKRIITQHMERAGLACQGSNNTADGVVSRYCVGSGIAFTDIAKTNGLIIDCVGHDNSDEFYPPQGGDADGIYCHHQDSNIQHCEAYHNSDDGFDILHSVRTAISHCVASDNGYGVEGNGQGFKMGSGSSSLNTIHHSISFNNLFRGFDSNGCVDLTYKNNTSFGNPISYTFVIPGLVENCIHGAGESHGGGLPDVEINNSWQRGDNPVFISTNPEDVGFLVPTPGGGYEDIGAFSISVTDDQYIDLYDDSVKDLLTTAGCNYAELDAAIGDDVFPATLDRADIQAQLDAAESNGGGTVTIPEGTVFNVTQHLFVPSNVRIQGAGANLTIFPFRFNSPTSVGYFRCDDCINVIIEHLSIDHTDNDTPAGQDHSGVSFYNSNNFLVQHCRVHVTRSGLQATSSTRGTFRYNTITRVAATGAGSHHCIVSNDCIAFGIDIGTARSSLLSVYSNDCRDVDVGLGIDLHSVLSECCGNLIIDTADGCKTPDASSMIFHHNTIRGAINDHPIKNDEDAGCANPLNTNTQIVSWANRIENNLTPNGVWRWQNERSNPFIGYLLYNTFSNNVVNTIRSVCDFGPVLIIEGSEEDELTWSESNIEHDYVTDQGVIDQDHESIVALTDHILRGVSDEVQEVFNRMEALSQGERDAIEIFVDSQVASGNWALIDEFVCPALNETDAMTGWIQLTMTPVGPAMEWTPNGWLHGGTNSWIDTHINPTTFGGNYTIENASISIFMQEWSYAGTGASRITGADGIDGSDLRLTIGGVAVENNSMRMNSGSWDETLITPDGVGHHTILISDDNTGYYRDGVLQGPGRGGDGGMPDDNIFIAAGNDGGVGTNNRECTWSAWHIGGDLPDYPGLYENIVILLNSLGVDMP